MKQGELKIYLLPNGESSVEVKVEDETVWLSLNQIASLFERDNSVISRHLKKIFNDGELDQNRVVAKNATVQNEGGRQVQREIEYFNLDAIISVGYRVNSKKATQFRIWANKILKSYLTRGYVIDRNRFIANKQLLIEAKNALLMIAEKSKLELLQGHESDLLDLVNEYAASWKILEEFDEQKIEIKKLNRQVKFEINYDGTLGLVGRMKDELRRLRLNIYMFGQEMGHKLESIVGAINQTFDGKDLYESIEEKAANLLYLVIKDHPFTDGNKRIGSMLFIYFLENNDYLYRSDGERKINDKTLIALALLVATSNPKEKENTVRLIISLIQN